jgi:hypothetical protein
MCFGITPLHFTLLFLNWKNLFTSNTNATFKMPATKGVAPNQPKNQKICATCSLNKKSVEDRKRAIRRKHSFTYFQEYHGQNGIGLSLPGPSVSFQEFEENWDKFLEDHPEEDKYDLDTECRISVRDYVIFNRTKQLLDCLSTNFVCDPNDTEKTGLMGHDKKTMSKLNKRVKNLQKYLPVIFKPRVGKDESEEVSDA